MTIISSPNFAADLGVAGIFLLHQGKILLLKRPPESKHPSKWGVPAGKLEKEETPIKAIIREVQEETGIVLDELRLVHHEKTPVRDEKNGRDFWYFEYAYEFLELPQVNINHEHEDFCWVTPKEALELDLIHDEDYCIKRFFKME